ncbi:unnamed protein product [Oncorhynchus mykiss]|uniref:Uncharacterized protein n=1 Tax=Oncorhynchus mykiss TaxID=8022 RepID=A0A061A6P4_ONCMY|nr:unnamed protein product [Oncorhynchus mykiss]
MKHLGVKSRVADSKKSRGFFRRPLGKNKKSEESTKSKQKGGFPNILSAAGGWIAGSTEVKLPKVEAEGTTVWLFHLLFPTPLSLEWFSPY